MKVKLLLIISVIFFTNYATAARVEKVKSKRALIVLDGLSVGKGDKLEAFNSSGKKTAILVVTTVKGNKAIADVSRGKVKVNQEIRLRGGSSSASSGEMPTSRKGGRRNSGSSSSRSTMALGGMLGVAFDTMKIDINVPVESISMTGIGFSLVGAGDYKLTEWFTLRGILGIEQFSVSGDSTQTSPTECKNCDAKIMYFTGMAWGKFNLIQSFWVGPGFGVQQPLSSSSNSIDTSSIKATAVYGIGAGFDIELSNNMFIPLQFEYGMQPKSDDVASSYFAGRLGVMFRY